MEWELQLNKKIKEKWSKSTIAKCEDELKIDIWYTDKHTISIVFSMTETFHF